MAIPFAGAIKGNDGISILCSQSNVNPLLPCEDKNYLYGMRIILRLYDGTVEDIISPLETKTEPEFDQASSVSENCHADVNIIPLIYTPVYRWIKIFKC